MTIYCGYQGTGKSTYVNAHKNECIDLDSSAFRKFKGWEIGYINMALSFSKLGKKVFVSAHKEVIEYCKNNKLNFAIVAPKESKEVWGARLEYRYYKNPNIVNLKAVNDFKQNFEKDMNYYKELESNGVRVCWIESKVVTNFDEFII